MMSKKQIGVAGIALGLAVVGGAGAWYFLRPAAPADEAKTAQLATAPPGPAETPKDRVTLTSEKLQAANLEIQELQLRSVPDTRVVPGRLQYDDRRHVQVRTAASGIVVEMLVKPGDRVAAGQKLAVLNSPEVGEARTEVLKRQAEFQLAQRKQEWESQVEKNLQPFVAAIQSQMDANELRQKFQQATLGEEREKLVSAYTRFTLAEALMKSADAISDSGVLATRTIQERTTERQAAEAALRATCEQALFDSRQRRDLAALTAEDTKRRWEISRHTLRTMLGYQDQDEPAEDTQLSGVEIRAPFPGTIEHRVYSSSERVTAGAEMFVLADTAKLWVAADIREHDWAALQLQPGKELTVRVPALAGRKFPAKVYYVGREVTADTNAIALVAELDNTDGLLRPGMFVQAHLEVSRQEVLAVPSSAVVSHDQKPFVFVAESDHDFRQVFVEVGHESDDWIVIRSGLQAGQRVVTRGAFVLKSELLLEPEE